MPIALPVPSKSALRTLRNLALGTTSCTVAISAGLLTEDRRRRINLARKIHNNAQVIKQSKQYNAAGAAVLEILDERAMQCAEDVCWLPSQVLKYELSQGLGRNQEKREAIESPSKEDSSFSSQSLEAPKPRPARKRSRPDHNGSDLPPRSEIKLGDPQQVPKTDISKKERKREIWPPRKEGASLLPTHGPERQHPKSKRILLDLSKVSLPPPNPQIELAEDINRLLAIPDVEAASARFFQASEKGFSVGKKGLRPRLKQVAIQLAKASRKKYHTFDQSNRVLEIVRSYTPVDEYVCFIDRAIRDLLFYPSDNPTDPALDHAHHERLQEAGELYLAAFKASPNLMAEHARGMVARLGETLCRLTCDSQMYKLTRDVHDRLCEYTEDKTPTYHLIKATYHLGHLKKIYELVQLFNAGASSTTELEYNRFIQNIGINSAIKLGEYENAENILVSAAQLAEQNGFLIPTTWFLKVLAGGWRARRNTPEMLAQFERLAPFLHTVRHPVEVYGAAINICCEVGEDSLALSLFNRLQSSSHELDALGSRIYGYLALAKAKRNDWEGVEKTFREWNESHPEADATLRLAFEPVLIIFEKTHTLQETEKFIQFYVQEFDLQLTHNMVNFMLQQYAQKKQIDSFSRWIDFAMKNLDYVPSFEAFNFMLKNRVFNLGFQNYFAIYRSIWHVTSHSKFFDNGTFSILQQMAIHEAPRLKQAQHWLEQLEPFAPPNQTNDTEAVFLAMQAAFATCNWTETLKIYGQAQEDRNLIKPRHALLAVRASLQVDGPHLEGTTELIQSMKLKDFNLAPFMTAVYIHQLNQIEGGQENTNTILELFERTYSQFNKANLDMPPPLINHTVSSLSARQPRLALNFWESISRRLGYEPDLATLTILLGSYIRLQDAAGVIWVTKMLRSEDNNIYPDGQLVLALNNARRHATDLDMEKPGNARTERFLEAVMLALNTVKVINEERGGEREKVSRSLMDTFKKAAEEGDSGEEGMAVGPETKERWLDKMQRDRGAFFFFMKERDGKWGRDPVQMEGVEGVIHHERPLQSA